MNYEELFALVRRLEETGMLEEILWDGATRRWPKRIGLSVPNCALREIRMIEERNH